jgi:hypothetical protein
VGFLERVKMRFHTDDPEDNLREEIATASAHALKVQGRLDHIVDLEKTRLKNIQTQVRIQTRGR